MSVLPLVHEQDDILYQETKIFNFENPEIDPEELEKNLIESMIEHRGIGLSANQVGISLSVFAMYWDSKPIVVFNPDIMEYGDENSYEKEGCLSYPGLMIAISRPNSIKAQFEVKDGSTKGAVFTDLSARIFQHEMEHMKGRDFFWEVSNIKLKQAMKKRKLHLKRMKRNAKI